MMFKCRLVSVVLNVFVAEVAASQCSELGKVYRDEMFELDGCTTVDLDDNSIGDEGAKALAEALKSNTALTTLYLDGNSIGADVKATVDAILVVPLANRGRESSNKTILAEVIELLTSVGGAPLIIFSVFIASAVGCIPKVVRRMTKKNPRSETPTPPTPTPPTPAPPAYVPQKPAAYYTNFVGHAGSTDNNVMVTAVHNKFWRPVLDHAAQRQHAVAAIYEEKWNGDLYKAGMTYNENINRWGFGRRCVVIHGPNGPDDLGITQRKEVQALRDRGIPFEMISVDVYLAL